MSTTTKNYQILQKLEGEGNYLKLHPETNASQVITSGGSNVQVELGARYTKTETNALLNGKYDVEKFIVEQDISDIETFIDYLNDIDTNIIISDYLGKIIVFNCGIEDMYTYTIIPTNYDNEGFLICIDSIYRIYMGGGTYDVNKYAKIEDITYITGLLSNLQTTNKTNLVSAINSLLEVVNKKANSTDVYTKNESDAKYPSLANGIIPQSYLPSYVDDVLEYEDRPHFPSIGEAGKIYVDKFANLTYRWSGSAYVEISPSLALGETASTAYAGNKGAALAITVSAMQTDVVRNESNITKITNGTTAVGKAKALDHDIDFYIDSDTLVGSDEASDFSGAEMHLNVELRTTGVPAGTYSCVSVDAYGRATAGAQIVEVGTTGQTAPSATLAIGGIFFKEI